MFKIFSMLVVIVGVCLGANRNSGGFYETFDSDTLIRTTTGQEAIFKTLDTFIVISGTGSKFFKTVDGKMITVEPPYQTFRIVKREVNWNKIVKESMSEADSIFLEKSKKELKEMKQ
jgi:hypothetical protein